MSNVVPDSLLRDMGTGAVDLDNDTFYMMLLTASFAPSKAFSKRSDIIAFEVTGGTGYAAGGQACTVTQVLNGGQHRYEIAHSDVAWASSSGWSAHYHAIYKRRGGAASADELVVMGDFLGDIPALGGTFTVRAGSPILISNPN